MILGDLNQARPNADGENATLQARRPIHGYQFFNASNVAIPTNSSRPFGNAPRNAARGPALFTLDLGLQELRSADGREPPRASSRGVQRAEPVELQPAEPLADVVRDITQIATGTTPRQVQLGVKVYF